MRGRPGGTARGECKLPVAGDLDRVPFLLEAFPDEAGNLPVVLDHQDAHTRPVVAHAPRPVNAAASTVLCSRSRVDVRAKPVRASLDRCRLLLRSRFDC